MKGKSDYIFLGMLGALLIDVIYQAVVNGYVFSLSNGLAVGGLVVVTILRSISPQKGRFALSVLLLLGLLNICNFFSGSTSMHVGFGNLSNETGWMTVNPGVLLIIIAYYVVNRKSVNKRVSNLFYGTAKDQAADFETRTNFYLEKFSVMSDTELARTSCYYDDHPPEARAALRQLIPDIGAAENSHKIK